MFNLSRLKKIKKIKANFYFLNEFQLFYSYSLTHKTIEVMLLEE